MKKQYVVSLFFVALLIIAVFIYMRMTKVDPRELYTVFDAYNIAIEKQDIAALKMIVLDERAKELDSPDAAEKLQLVAGFSPPKPRIVGVEIKDDAAVLKLEADPQSAPTLTGKVALTGKATLRRKNRVWKIDKVEWSMSIDATSEQTAGTASTASPPPPTRLLSPEAAAVLNRLSGSDVNDAIKAWNELSMRYSDEKSLIADYGAAMFDERPLPFFLIEKAWTGRDPPMRYYEAEQQGPGTIPSEVGYALRAQLWRVADASYSRVKHLDDWFNFYAKTHHITKPEEVVVGRPMTEAETREAFPVRDPKILATGYAEVTVDDEHSEYELATGFFSETRFDNPEQAILEFRRELPNNEGNFMVLLSFDATRTGIQETNGTSIMLEHRRTGQRWFPASTCKISISSPYTGKKSSQLAGRVDNCHTHSAGIDHFVSALFSVDGSLVKPATQ